MSAPSSLGALVRLFLRLGFAGFGGPLVHIAIMETEVVERRRWFVALHGLHQRQLIEAVLQDRFDVRVRARAGDESALAREFAIPHVSLINDFYAVALGVPLLGENDLLS